jgi:predicted component of type VI protein secretion system
MSLNAKLIVVGGEVKTAEIRLRLPSTIGRGRGASIMLPHPLVSRQHCELFEADGRLMVRDLGSLNGTFINNERISEAPLPTGELLTIGAVTFRAVYEALEGSIPPPGPAPQLKAGRDTDPGAPRMAAATNSPPASPAVDDEPLESEFDFDQPLASVDEVSHSGRSGGPKTDATVEDVGQAAADSAQPAGKPPASARTGKAEEATVDFSKWEREEEVQARGEDDDDFGDFLKSLGGK